MWNCLAAPACNFLSQLMTASCIKMQHMKSLNLRFVASQTWTIYFCHHCILPFHSRLQTHIERESRIFVIACACIWCRHFLFVNMIHTYHNLSLSYFYSSFLSPTRNRKISSSANSHMQLHSIVCVSNYIINIKLIEYVIKEHWISCRVPSFIMLHWMNFSRKQTHLFYFNLFVTFVRPFCLILNSAEWIPL